MKREQILEGIKTLATSQGSYGRMLKILQQLEKEDNDKYEEIMETLEKQNFKDIVEFILYIEC
ncbi:MAG: hypothetical protein PHX70_14415 [Clostridium sp.]|nr:hypothetical protein [Clostridium sp.]